MQVRLSIILKFLNISTEISMLRLLLFGDLIN